MIAAHVNRPQSTLLYLVAFCLLGTVGLLVLWAPYTHNPDADCYYGVALRISRGEFLKSIDGQCSPLISWFMGALIWAGVAVPDSFRLVNLTAFAIYLYGTIAICRQLLVSDFAVSSVLILVSVLALPYTIFIVTSDLLAAAIFAWIVYLLLGPYSKNTKNQLTVGALAGLAYLAKNIFFVLFPIFLLATIICPSLFQFKTRGRALRASLFTIFPFLLISLPWILLISRKYGALVVSAQQLSFYGPILGPDYHPDLPRQMFLTGMRPNPEVPADYSIWECIRDASESLVKMFQLAYRYLYPQLTIIHLGAFSSLAFLLVVLYCIYKKTVQREPKWNATIILALAYVLTYLAIWGGHVRYYLPILPLLILFVVEGVRLFRNAFATSSRVIISHSIVALVALSAFEIGCSNFNYAKLLWYSVDQELLFSLVRAPELTSKSCAITGEVHDGYSGLVAALLKREKWNSLHPTVDVDTEQVRSKLELWSSCQLLWLGELMPALSNVNFIYQVLQIQKGNIEIRVFDIR